MYYDVVCYHVTRENHETYSKYHAANLVSPLYQIMYIWNIRKHTTFT